MAIFRYIGGNRPNPKSGDYTVIVPTSVGRLAISHQANEDFIVPDDEVTIAALEYHIDVWTKEYDFLRVG